MAATITNFTPVFKLNHYHVFEINGTGFGTAPNLPTVTLADSSANYDWVDVKVLSSSTATKLRVRCKPIRSTAGNGFYGLGNLTITVTNVSEAPVMQNPAVPDTTHVTYDETPP